jgi:hypothetical protein
MSDLGIIIAALHDSEINGRGFVVLRPRVVGEARRFAQRI